MIPRWSGAYYFKDWVNRFDWDTFYSRDLELDRLAYDLKIFSILSTYSRLRYSSSC